MDFVHECTLCKNIQSIFGQILHVHIVYIIAHMHETCGFQNIKMVPVFFENVDADTEQSYILT